MDQENPEDKYPRVTRAQLEIWLADPTTQKYLQCLTRRTIILKKHLGEGGCIHESDPVKTHTESHILAAQTSAYFQASQIEDFFTSFDMLEKEDDEPKEESADGQE